MSRGGGRRRGGSGGVAVVDELDLFQNLANSQSFVLKQVTRQVSACDDVPRIGVGGRGCRFADFCFRFGKEDASSSFPCYCIRDLQAKVMHMEKSGVFGANDTGEGVHF